MTFHWPYVLLALPVALAALLALFARSYRARQRLLSQFAAARLLPALLASYSPGLRRVKHVLVLAGVLLVVLALARPQWGYDWEQQRSRGVDVIFAIDTSKSMLTQDVAPNRLERAKLAIMDLVEKMEGNRVGLVAFAGQSFLQCPLTLDYDAFRQSLEAVDTNTIARGGTNIAAGINEAAAALENSGNHKVIVLVTDGEDLEGQGISAAKSLRDQGVIIYTVGVGTPQGDIIPVTGADGQVDFVRDDQGNIVKSHLDAATLTAISQATNGFYQPLGATGEGLTRIYEAGIKPLPQQQLASSLQRQAIERFQWPLALGLLLLAIDPVIGTRRLFRTEERRRSALATANLPPLAPTGKPAARAATTVVAALVLAVAWMNFAPHAHAQSTPSLSPSTPPAPTFPPQPSSAPSTATPTASTPSSNPSTAVPAPSAPGSASPRLAEQLFRQGNYKAAAEAYGQAADANPQDSRFRYDQGASLYRSGDYAGAAQAFQQSLSANDLNLQQHAYYGMGDARYRVGQAQLKEDPKKTVTTWQDAAKDYQNALDLNPGDADASYNLTLLKKQLDELKKQLEQQQKQQQQNQQNQQNQSDQQNQQNQSQQQQNQQNQNNQQQNQQNQQGQQGQQQNQQGQQQSQQNQQGQQGQQQPQQNGGQQQQNQQGQSGNQGQNQQQNQNSGSQQNQQPQNQSQNQGQQQNGSQQQNQGQSQQPNQSQNQSGQNGQQPQSQQQPGQQNQNPSQSQQPNGQPKPQPGTQGQQPGANPQQPNGQGTEPDGTKPGQQPSKSGSAAAGGTASGEQTDANGNATASAPGVMTREEARQVLDSLKNTERKLPVTNYDSNKDGAQESPDQPYKDW